MSTQNNHAKHASPIEEKQMLVNNCHPSKANFFLHLALTFISDCVQNSESLQSFDSSISQFKVFYSIF